MLVKKNVGHKITLDQKFKSKMLSSKQFGVKKFLSQKNFMSK